MSSTQHPFTSLWRTDQKSIDNFPLFWDNNLSFSPQQLWLGNAAFLLVSLLVFSPLHTFWKQFHLSHWLNAVGQQGVSVTKRIAQQLLLDSFGKALRAGWREEQEAQQNQETDLHWKAESYKPSKSKFRLNKGFICFIHPSQETLYVNWINHAW